MARAPYLVTLDEQEIFASHRRDRHDRMREHGQSRTEQLAAREGCVVVPVHHGGVPPPRSRSDQGPVHRMPDEQDGAHPQDGGPAWIASMMAASVSG